MTSHAVEDLEPLAGMSHLNGVPVRMEPVEPPPEPAAGEAELAAAG